MLKAKAYRMLIFYSNNIGKTKEVKLVENEVLDDSKTVSYSFHALKLVESDYSPDSSLYMRSEISTRFKPKEVKESRKKTI